MKFIVLGGCGTQGRTALYDLALDRQVSEIICADVGFEPLSQIEPFTDMAKIRTVKMDARNRAELLALYKQGDMIIDLLPKEFKAHVYDTALETGISVVNTNYMHDTADLDKKARQAGIAVMPECGLDPGIDLVIYGDALARFDSLTEIHSYCGGFPERSACTNPMNYKLSWIWQGVLSSINRDGRIIKNGHIVDIPGSDIHEPAHIHSIEFPGLGTLEAIVNGDAAAFTRRMGLTAIENTGRYSLRWPGWSEFWRPLKALGFLDQTPVPGLSQVTPMEFMDKHLAPRLKYEDREKDLVVMLNIFEGLIDDKPQRLTSTMLIERDLATGLMAMSKGVAYTACTVAKMIAQGEISEKGVLSPTSHIPVKPFMDRLKKRGIVITETMEAI